jgi:hypothetical protein
MHGNEREKLSNTNTSVGDYYPLIQIGLATQKPIHIGLDRVALYPISL